MTKITNKYKIFHRYEEDLWGFLVFKKKKSRINKIIYLSQIDQFKKIDIRFLEVISKAPRGKRIFFRTLIGKANSLSLYLRRYFTNVSQRQLKIICLRTTKVEASHKKNIAYLIESRIDAILLRTNLFTSIRTIKQWIIHGFVLVNLKKVWTPNQHIKIGDIVSFSREKKILLYKQFFALYFKKLNKKKVISQTLKYWQWKNEKKKEWLKTGIPLYKPKYLEQNYKLFFFYLWRSPFWHELPFLKKFKSFHITGPAKNRLISTK